jgi:hypothetical protein
MDERERRQIIINKHLQKLMDDVKSVEDLGYSKRFIEYYEQKGYDVKKFKIKQEYREGLLLAVNYN